MDQVLTCKYLWHKYISSQWNIDVIIILWFTKDYHCTMCYQFLYNDPIVKSISINHVGIRKKCQSKPSHRHKVKSYMGHIF